MKSSPCTYRLRTGALPMKRVSPAALYFILITTVNVVSLILQNILYTHLIAAFTIIVSTLYSYYRRYRRSEINSVVMVNGIRTISKTVSTLHNRLSVLEKAVKKS
jgi:hypothetical protein